MQLWLEWFRCVSALRPACSRYRTFVWMVLALVGLCIRSDRLGVTSFVRSAFLHEKFYPHLLHFFHSSAVKVPTLTHLWARHVLTLFTPLTFKGHLVLVGDGLKVPKAGKKMPAVKNLHQESNNNTKPSFIMGHSFQAVGLLVKTTCSQLFCVPLASRIHEGLVWSNRDRRTLLDKMVLLVQSLAASLQRPLLFLVDAYFASRKVIRPLLKEGHHIVTRVRSNAVAFFPAAQPEKRRRGRPRIYGRKVKLRGYWAQKKQFCSAESPVYGEKGVSIRYLVKDLIWRPVGTLVRFVFVEHPTRGRLILMSTLTSLTPLEIIELYGHRFKIEVSFKQALHTIGAYAYHFWMSAMTPIGRRSGNQYLHRTSDPYRKAVKRKMHAYHVHVQLGCIAQGLLQYLAACFPALVWTSFRSWLRTMHTDRTPSEMVAAQALRVTLPEFLVNCGSRHKLAKIIADHADPDRLPRFGLTG